MCRGASGWEQRFGGCRSCRGEGRERPELEAGARGQLCAVPGSSWAGLRDRGCRTGDVGQGLQAPLPSTHTPSWMCCSLYPSFSSGPEPVMRMRSSNNGQNVMQILKNPLILILFLAFSSNCILGKMHRNFCDSHSA